MNGANGKQDMLASWQAAEEAARQSIAIGQATGKI